MVLGREIQDALDESMAVCIGCNNEYPFKEMNPADEGQWICRPCYYRVMECVIW